MALRELSFIVLLMLSRWLRGFFLREVIFDCFNSTVNLSCERMEETEVLCCPCIRDLYFPGFKWWLMGVIVE